MFFFRRFTGNKRDSYPLSFETSESQSLLDVISSAKGSSRALFTQYQQQKSTLSNDKLLATFGPKGKARGQVNNPGGIAATSTGDTVVADTENNRVQIFSAKGELKHVIGEKGHEPHELSHPSDVTIVSRDGAESILVTDSVNSCVKLFSQSGTCLDIYRCRPGLMEYPCGICVSREGCVVVTDLIEHRVVVLSQSGSEITTFGGYGSRPDQFDHPYYITSDSRDRLVVSDYGNMAIKLFTISGELLHCFSVSDFHVSRDDFVQLQGLATDDAGNVLVVANASAFILTNNGRLWDIVPPSPGLENLRAIAYSSGKLLLTRDTTDRLNQILVFEYCPDNFKSLQCLPEPGLVRIPTKYGMYKKSTSISKSAVDSKSDTIPRKSPLSELAQGSAKWSTTLYKRSSEDPTVRKTTRTGPTRKCVTFLSEDGVKTRPEICKRADRKPKTSSLDQKTSRPSLDRTRSPCAPGNSVTHKPGDSSTSEHHDHEYDYILGRQMPTLDYDLIERKHRMKAKSHTRISPAHIFSFQ